MTLQVVYYTPPMIELASKTPCAYSEMCSQPRLCQSTPFYKWDDCIWGHYPSRRKLWAMEGKLPCTKLDKHWSRGRVWSRGPWNCNKNRIAGDDNGRQTMISISKEMTRWANERTWASRPYSTSPWQLITDSFIRWSNVEIIMNETE